MGIIKWKNVKVEQPVVMMTAEEARKLADMRESERSEIEIREIMKEIADESENGGRHIFVEVDRCHGKTVEALKKMNYKVTREERIYGRGWPMKIYWGEEHEEHNAQ